MFTLVHMKELPLEWMLVVVRHVNELSAYPFLLSSWLHLLQRSCHRLVYAFHLVVQNEPSIENQSTMKSLRVTSWHTYPEDGS